MNTLVFSLDSWRVKKRNSLACAPPITPSANHSIRCTGAMHLRSRCNCTTLGVMILLLRNFDLPEGNSEGGQQGFGVPRPHLDTTRHTAWPAEHSNEHAAKHNAFHLKCRH